MPTINEMLSYAYQNEHVLEHDLPVNKNFSIPITMPMAKVCRFFDGFKTERFFYQDGGVVNWQVG